MARRKLRRSTLFTMIALIGLLSLGIGYAVWTQTLTISGTVTTADFDVDWGTATLDDTSEDLHGNGTCSIGPENTDKNLDVDLDNAYPGFYCIVSTSVENNGEVAVAAAANPVFTASDPGVDVQLVNCDLLAQNPIAPSSSATCVFKVGIDSTTTSGGSTYNVSGTVTYNLP